ncbi:hypothetical protein HDU97_001161 [Phlyctochytrium planicorne]|nr:hypothetical protein HDU97_001161 [Phlyctochytrium planicorne]
MTDPDPIGQNEGSAGSEAAAMQALDEATKHVDIEDDGSENELTLDASEAITEAMKNEEREIEEENEKEYKKRMQEESKKEFNEHIAEQRRNRLNTLLTRAGFYSKWLGSRLELRQKEQADLGRAVHANSVENDVEEASSNSKKRKQTPTKKKAKGRNLKRSKTMNDALDMDDAPGEAKEALPPAERSHRQPSLITGCTMREYQIIGTEWLISLWEQGLNGILADEMGLGKTLQTIAFIAHLVEMKVWGPYLIISPLSTLSNWVSEIHRFAPSLNVLLYHGSSVERKALRTEKMSVLDSNFPIIVTSYEISMRDRRYLQKFNWKYIIIDEGHRLKNFNCRLLRELKTYPCANRLILSGTPLQNNLAELWSLLNFLMPDIFKNLEDFEGWFDFDELNEGDDRKILDKEAKESVVTNLHQILKPFLLRRVKTEVEIEIPKKRELLLFAPIVPRQKQLYDASVKGTGGLRDFLIKQIEEKHGLADVTAQENEDSVMDADTSDDGKSIQLSPRRSKRSKSMQSYDENTSDDAYFDSLENPIPEEKKEELSVTIRKEAAKIVGGQSLQNVLMQLRKICNHPYLFNLHIEGLPQPKGSAASAPSRRSGKKSTKKEVAVRLPDIVASSGKMLMLERLLPRLLERGHKVLIFSQMTRMLDILAEWFEEVKKWKACRIDGSIPLEERRQQIQAFNTSKEHNIFLLSTRAGGLGINLTAADTVIIYDSDWNPQVDLQAQDRVHRIGQTKPVIIYRLVTSGTVEKKILDRASSKRKLEKLVIHKSEFKGKLEYYNSNQRVSNLEELSAILEADDTEEVTLSSVDPESMDGDMILLDRVISDEELERIMDRSPEAFERKERDGTKTDSKFKEIISEPDALNDSLAAMSD